MGLTEIIEAERRFVKKYESEVLPTGYALIGSVSRIGMCVLDTDKNKNDYCIVANISPLPGSKDPVSLCVMAEIKEKILPKTFEEYNVYVHYLSIRK